MDIARKLQPLKQRDPELMGIQDLRRYGIFMPLVKVNDDIHLLFEVRSMQMRSQPGDVCFPGGRMDQTDRTPMACALRETKEEIGIGIERIYDVIPLDYVVVDTRIIYPFAGKVNRMEPLTINHKEVEEVFTVPLQFFLEHQPRIHKVNLTVEPEKNFPYDLIQNGKSYDWRKREMNELFYQYEDRVIWGLTAKIIHHFIQMIK